MSKALLKALHQAKENKLNEILNLQETGTNSPELQKLIGQARAYREIEDIKAFIEFTIDEALNDDRFGV